MVRTGMLKRAWRAYQTIEGTNAAQPVMHRSGEHVIDGLPYVALRSERRVLAIYRIRKSNGKLRRLRHWPLELGCNTDAARPASDQDLSMG